MERDRPGGARLDGAREPDEGRPRAPGAALRAGAGDSRRGPEAGRRRRESDRVRRKRGRAMGGEQMGRLLGKHRITAVPHGFRRRSGTGPPKRRTIPGRSSRRRWPMWSATRSRPPTCAPTCSSGGVVSWTTGRATSRARGETRRAGGPADPLRSRRRRTSSSTR